MVNQNIFGNIFQKVKLAEENVLVCERDLPLNWSIDKSIELWLQAIHQHALLQEEISKKEKSGAKCDL